jgi:uncharacterized membrane protein
MSYLVLKTLHILFVIAFVGNITTGLFWARRAMRTRDLRRIADTFDGITQSDRVFTIPGVIGIIVTGIAVAIQGGLPILSTGWIFWPIVLFAISGIVFGAWVAPLQRRIRELATSDPASDSNWATVETLFRRWEFWGALALLTPVAAAAIMVFKPALPGV